VRLTHSRRKYLVILPILLAPLVVLEYGFFVGSTAVADDGIQRPLETGEVGLRETLCEALRVDAERYPFGEIECELTNRHAEGPVYIESARVHSWWLDGNSFTTIQERTTIDPSFIRSRQPVEGIQVLDTSMEQTVSNSKIMIVNKTSARALIQDLAKQPRMLNTSVTPADFWFGKVAGEGADWFRTLGPSPKTPASDVKQCDTQKLPGERLLITTTLNGDLGTSRAVASIRHWKVLSVDQKLRFDGKDQRFSWLYNWSKDGKVLERVVFRLKAGERPTLERVYEVKKLDVVNKPSMSRFDIDESKLPSGYIVEDKIAKRQYTKK
jgi:hypothetical protein